MQNKLIAALKPKYTAFPIELLLPFLLDFLTGFLSKCNQDNPAEAAWSHIDNNSYTARAAMRLGLQEWNKTATDDQKIAFGTSLTMANDILGEFRALGQAQILNEVANAQQGNDEAEAIVSQLI